MQAQAGDIELNSVEGPVRASTGSGAIRATGITSDFKGTTGSGDVIVEQSTTNDMMVETGSGNVVIRNVRGALRVSTASGSISVKVPAQASFDLDAKTSSGTIHTAREITVPGSLGKKDLRGKVGASGHLVQLSTASGDIRID